MKTFDINTQTIGYYEWTPASAKQAEKAKRLNAVRIFETRQCDKLPKYITEALTSAGFAAKRIGYTTYVSSTWAIFAI